MAHLRLMVFKVTEVLEYQIPYRANTKKYHAAWKCGQLMSVLAIEQQHSPTRCLNCLWILSLIRAYGENIIPLGNLGSPRQNRIFIDRAEPSEFIFLAPYDKFIVQPSKFHFTSTLSPITNLSYSTAGDRTDGEDQFKALFAINAGKKWGFGFKFDYLYGRGYYSNQNTSHINYSFWGAIQAKSIKQTFFLRSTIKRSRKMEV